VSHYIEQYCPKHGEYDMDVDNPYLGCPNCEKETKNMEYEHSASMAQIFGETQYLLQRPHVRMRPRVFKDGDSWCCLYGENIMEGVVGFGPTPNDACMDFDKTWWNGEKKEPKP